MRIIEKSAEITRITASIDETTANAIRRTVLEIPTLAIDEVEIFKNDSVLYDEVVAHRLGLVPLMTEDGGKSKKKTEVTLKISRKGPATVYSGELEGNAKPVFGKMPITLLTEGQELEVLATANHGRGIEHAKYNPGMIYYREYYEAVPKKGAKLCDECLKNVITNIINPKSKDGELEFIRKTCNKCGTKVQDFVKENEDNLEIRKGEGLLISIESFGQIPSTEILKKAITILKENTEALAKKQD